MTVLASPATKTEASGSVEDAGEGLPYRGRYWNPSRRRKRNEKACRSNNPIERLFFAGVLQGGGSSTHWRQAPRICDCLCCRVHKRREWCVKVGISRRLIDQIIVVV